MQFDRVCNCWSMSLDALLVGIKFPHSHIKPALHNSYLPHGANILHFEIKDLTWFFNINMCILLKNHRFPYKKNPKIVLSICQDMPLFQEISLRITVQARNRLQQQWWVALGPLDEKRYQISTRIGSKDQKSFDDSKNI